MGVPYDQPPPFPPVPPYPIGVNDTYTQHTHEVSLEVRERPGNVSADEFDITETATGAMLFRVTSKAFSFSGEKYVTDTTQRKPLFTIRNDSVSPRKYIGCDAKTNREVFSVKRPAFSNGTALKIKFRNTAAGAGGKDVTLVTSGEWLDPRSEIKLENGRVVARIRRQFKNTNEFVFGRHNYTLTVAPAIDTSLLVAICICLDRARTG